MMKMKVFHADTMHDAIRAIKEELGPDALILSTKRVKRGSLPFSIFGRSLLEVTAATDSSPEQAVHDQQATSPSTQDDALPVERQREPAPPFQDTLNSLLRSPHPPESGIEKAKISSPSTKPAPHSASQWRFRHLKHELLDLQQQLTSSLPERASLRRWREPAVCW
jgi:flagellar biosynthesis protein FlhF